MWKYDLYTESDPGSLKALTVIIKKVPFKYYQNLLVRKKVIIILRSPTSICRERTTYLRFSCHWSIIVHSEPAFHPISEQCDTVPVPQFDFVFTCYDCNSSATVEPGSMKQRGQDDNITLTK